MFSVSFNMDFHSYGISIGNHSLRQRFADWCPIIVSCGAFRCKGETGLGKDKNHTKIGAGKGLVVAYVHLSVVFVSTGM